MGARRRAAQRAFTLVEMVIVTLLFVIVGTGLLYFLTSCSEFWEVSTAQVELRSEAERTMNDLARELQLATRATGAAPPNLQIPNPPGNTTMTFFVPADLDGQHGVLDAIGNIEWALGSPVQFQHDAATRRLSRVQGPATRVIANDVANVAFNDQGSDPSLYANEVRVTLTLQRATSHQRTVAASATAVVRLRN